MLAEIQVTDQMVENALMIPSVSIIKDQENKDFVFTANKTKEGNFKIDKAGVKVLSKIQWLGPRGSVEWRID